MLFYGIQYIRLSIIDNCDVLVYEYMYVCALFIFCVL